MEFCISVAFAKRNQQCYVKKKQYSVDASCGTQAFGFTCLVFFSTEGIYEEKHE